MGHLIATIRNCTINEALDELTAAHSFIAHRARAAIVNVPDASSAWGARAKRLDVELGGVDRPRLVEKTTEKFAEVVNTLATAERLIAALRWFSANGDFQTFRVRVCHPSTSSVTGENDLVLVDEHGTVRVRCEVCDVISTSAGQNGK